MIIQGPQTISSPLAAIRQAAQAALLRMGSPPLSGMSVPQAPMAAVLSHQMGPTTPPMVGPPPVAPGPMTAPMLPGSPGGLSTATAPMTGSTDQLTDPAQVPSDPANALSGMQSPEAVRLAALLHLRQVLAAQHAAQMPMHQPLPPDPGDAIQAAVGNAQPQDPRLLSAVAAELESSIDPRVRLQQLAARLMPARFHQNRWAMHHGAEPTFQYHGHPIMPPVRVDGIIGQ